MNGHEDERFRLRIALAEYIRDELAARLMEAQPPHNWPEVATKKDLAMLGPELRVEIAGLRAEFHSLLRIQFFQLTIIFTVVNTLMVIALRFGR